MSKFKLAGDWDDNTVTDAINAIVMPNEYLGNTLFKIRKNLSSYEFEIPIKRKDKVIYTLTDKDLSLKHFIKSETFLERDVKYLTSLEQHKILREADLITSIQKSIKNDFSIPLEIERINAIKGIVGDYEFKNDSADIEFKNENLLGKLDTISNNLTDEFGYTPEFIILSSREFYNKAQGYAISKKHFSNGIVEYKKSKYTLSNALNYNEIQIVNYGKKIEPNIAYAIPINTTDTFIEYYINKKDDRQYLSIIKELIGENGYKVHCEYKSMPICIRPYAINKLLWSD